MRGRGGGNGDRLHQVDRALAYTERTSGTLQDLLSVADVLLKVGEAVPIFGPACKVARDILAEVSASADKVDDVLEAGRRVVDTLKVLNILKENLSRLGGAERAELECVMRGLESLLQDMKEVLLSFRSRGWFKRVVQLGKHAKTLKRLDGLIRDKMELAMNLYRFAQDAAASATQQQLLQLLQERSYALEEAVAEKVDERVRDGRMTEEAAIADLENDADALSDVARTARISEQALLDEFRAFGAEVCKQYEHVQESLMKINAAVEALRQRPANGLDLYEYVRKPNAKPRATDKKAATLGSGSFGTTYQMRKRQGVAQLHVAVKVINEDAFDSEDADEKDVLISAEKLEREAVQLSLIRHPNIVQYIEAFWHESDDEGRQFVIVTELLTGGSFTPRTMRRPLPTEEMLATWLGQIASGLAHLHEERMLHRRAFSGSNTSPRFHLESLTLCGRDLKPDNVLFDSRDRAKIIDLGLACTVDSKSRGKTRSGGSSGTNLYMSPEKCLGAGHDSKEDDIWALGCLLAAGLVGDPLLGASGKYNFAVHRPNVEKLIGDSCRESKRLGSFVRAMLEQDPRRRPTAHQVVQQLLVQEPSGGGKGETDEVARLKEQLAQATAAKEAAERAAAERFAAAEKAAAEKNAATERAAAEKAAAERAASEKAAAEKAAAQKAAAQKAATVQKAADQPSVAAIENFCSKVGIRDVQSVRQTTTLDWSCEEINADDCKVIAYLIASGALAKLTVLNLYSNEIGDEGIKVFSSALASGALANLTILDLRANQIGDAGMKIFSETVASGALANLTVLALNNNQIGDAGIKIFSETVASGALANLTELYLGGNKIGDEGIKTFSTALASGALANLTALGLGVNQIGDAGIKIFSETVASGALANLTALGLGGNQIGDAGIKIFSETVASGALANLTELWLNSNKIGDEGIKTFSSALASGALANLTKLGLGGNQISDAGIKIFSETVASGALAKLTEFYIDNKHMKNPCLVAACQRRGIKIK